MERIRPALNDANVHTASKLLRWQHQVQFRRSKIIFNEKNQIIEGISPILAKKIHLVLEIYKKAAMHLYKNSNPSVIN